MLRDRESRRPPPQSRVGRPQTRPRPGGRGFEGRGWTWRASGSEAASGLGPPVRPVRVTPVEAVRNAPAPGASKPLRRRLLGVARRKRLSEPVGTETTDPQLRTWLRSYYGDVLKQSEDLATNACCAVGAPTGLVASALARVHPEVTARFYGCGYPFPEALEGTTVLDLGCGAGRDCYVLAQLVGPKGRVIGVDMTDAQLEVARSTVDWHTERFGYEAANVRFHEGFIEDLAALGIADESVDVVVSNCVVNLSPAKERVLAEAFRVLRPGGEFFLSDVVADRRLPESVVRDPVLYAECLGGALYAEDFLSLARRTGFDDPRVVTSAPITVQSPEVAARVGNARFTSATYRLFKLGDLEERCEDYGQVATYRGGLPGAEHRFVLDDHHAFEAGRPERVCGNTASMLSDTRLGPHFRVDGDRAVHHGRFPCNGTLAAVGDGASEAGDGPSEAGDCCP